MTKYSRESLEKLLTLIDTIVLEPEHNWFREELVKRCNIDSSHLSFVRKEYKKKGMNFYNGISDKSLKKQLVQDHTEMMFYLMINNTGRFLLYVNLQLENLLNAYCHLKNAHQTIEYSQAKVQVNIKNYGKDWFIDCESRFFDNNNLPKDIKIVDLWAKIGFWVFHSKNQIFAEKNYYNFHNIINARNLYSHRHTLETENLSLEKTNQMVELLKNNSMNSTSFYFSILQKIMQTF